MSSKSTNLALRKLQNKWRDNKFVCVGLDPEYGKLPSSVRKKDRSGSISEFNKRIIDATSEWAATFKPNSAFYEAEGDRGITSLKKTIDYIKRVDSDMFILLDAKRGDIGNTNRGYTKFIFDVMGADGTTVHPYQGATLLLHGKRSFEALEPFFEERDKIIFVLIRTSNPSAGEIQDLPVSLKSVSREYAKKFGNLRELGEILGQDIAPLYLVVAYIAVRHWNPYGNLGLMIGATYPAELAAVRKIAPDLPILMPGIGPQKGSLEVSVKAGLDSKKKGIIINSSRGIIYASSGADFAAAAGNASRKLSEQINSYR